MNRQSMSLQSFLAAALFSAGTMSAAQNQPPIVLTDIPPSERGAVNAPAPSQSPLPGTHAPAPRAQGAPATVAAPPVPVSPEAIAEAVKTATGIRLAGAPAGYAISKGAVDGYRKQRPTATVTEPGIKGTAASFHGLCAGQLDAVHVSRPIQKDELAACAQARVEFIEVPIAFDAVTLVTNTRNTFLDRITVEELRKLWGAAAEGKVLRWNDINARWPAAPIRLFGPERLADETHYFNDAILGKDQASRADYTGSIDMNIVLHGVTRDANSLAYVPLAYYLGNTQRFKAVPVVGSAGVAVTPTVENVAAGRYQPLSRPLFLYVNAQSLQREAVREFVEYYLANGSRFAALANYVPLTAASYREGVASVKNLKRGTAWAGTVPVGLTLETLQKKQAAL